MLKRVFWLLLLTGLGVAAWLWLRQRQGDASDAHFPPLDSAPQMPPSRGSTASAHAPGPPPHAPTMPLIRAPEAGPAPQDIQARTGPPGEPLTDVTDDPPPNAAVMETPPAPFADAEDKPSDVTNGLVAYCVRCREKRPMQDAHEETTENGRHAARGTCPVCGANMFTFLPDA